jgi:hypothetical protein
MHVKRQNKLEIENLIQGFKCIPDVSNLKFWILEEGLASIGWSSYD